MVGVRQFDEQEVLAKALELFWRKGLAATSMPDLAESTNVLRGSLYNAYGDKEALFLKAFDIYAQRFLASAQAGLSGRTAEEALSGFFDAAVSNMTSGDPSRGCLTTKTATDGSADSPQVQERLQKLIADLEALITQALTGFAEELVVAPAEAANLIVTFTRGLAVMERIHASPARLRASAHAFIRSLTRDRPVTPPAPKASRPRRAKAAVHAGSARSSGL